MSSMKERENERRGSQRAFFTLEENISARVTFSNGPGEQSQSIPVTLLSICLGGLSFLVARHKFPGLKPGDRLKVTHINTPMPLGSLNNIEVEIKYINDYKQGPCIVVGVKFTDILQFHRKRIFDYVNHRLSKLGLDK